MGAVCNATSRPLYSAIASCQRKAAVSKNEEVPLGVIACYGAFG